MTFLERCHVLERAHHCRSPPFPQRQGRAGDRSPGDSRRSRSRRRRHAEAPAKKKRSVRSFLLPIIGLALLSGGAWYGYDYWTTGRFMISTDDAYVQADMAFVSPKISGYVDQVKVEREPAGQGRRPAADDRRWRLQDRRCPGRGADRHVEPRRSTASTRRPRPRRRRCSRPRRRRSPTRPPPTTPPAPSSAPRNWSRRMSARRRSWTMPRPRSTRPMPRWSAPMRRSPPHRPISACSRRSAPKSASTLASLAARPRQGRARPVLHRAQGAL